MEINMRPKLYQVVPFDDFSVVLFYDNGEIKKYDCSWVLKEDGIFNNIHSATDFKSKCCIMNNTLAFDIAGNFDTTKCIDICPDTLYTESVQTKDIFAA
jgi:hypothetical protein